jgi:ABC-type branched-subunit amino acid transport system ATPase component
MGFNDIILSVQDVVAGYNKKEILQGASLRVLPEEIVALIGPNGSGKSTLLKVVSGLLKPKRGKVVFNGEDITGLESHKHIEKGIAYLMQESEIFPSLTVGENLQVAGHRLDESRLKERRNWIFHLFPQLTDLQSRRAGLLSGGQRQMLALGMILLQKPKLLLLDEPSAGGLTPALAKEVFETLKRINEEEKVSILLVEQNIREAVKICHRVYLLKDGKTYSEEHPAEILQNGKLEQMFFGHSIIDVSTIN